MRTYFVFVTALCLAGCGSESDRVEIPSQTSEERDAQDRLGRLASLRTRQLALSREIESIDRKVAPVARRYESALARSDMIRALREEDTARAQRRRRDEVAREKEAELRETARLERLLVTASQTEFGLFQSALALHRGRGSLLGGANVEDLSPLQRSDAAARLLRHARDRGVTRAIPILQAQFERLYTLAKVTDHQRGEDTSPIPRMAASPLSESDTLVTTLANEIETYTEKRAGLELQLRAIEDEIAAMGEKP